VFLTRTIGYYRQATQTGLATHRVDERVALTAECPMTIGIFAAPPASLVPEPPLIVGLRAADADGLLETGDFTNDRRPKAVAFSFYRNMPTV